MAGILSKQTANRLFFATKATFVSFVETRKIFVENFDERFFDEKSYYSAAWLCGLLGCCVQFA